MSFWSGLGWCGLVALALSAPGQSEDAIPRELAREASLALQARKSEIEGSLGIVHEWVERLRAAGERKRALVVLKKAVAAAPRDMICQGLYAETLNDLGQVKAAEKTARWVLEHACEDRARDAARRVFGEPVRPVPPKLERSVADPIGIVLVALPPVEVGLVQAVAERLKGEFPIEVRIRSFPFRPLPQAERGSMLLEVGQHRARFDKDASESEVQALLKETGFTAEELRVDHVFVTAYRGWLRQTDRWKNLRLFDLGVTRQYRPQWSGEQIMDCTINKQIALVRRPQDILLLVTGADLFFTKDLGFNFAVSGNRWSVISYNRFLPWFTGEMPEWKKLVTRTFKQVLCSVGRSVGIAKCSSPRCACRYANGLRDHDAKTEICCPECRARIEAAIRS
ncbi:MAG: hypothetical protein JXQ29_06020 [Planctomycetes bacterium]|nr:hypothetical protein [Planctomycetota bacterium]